MKLLAAVSAIAALFASASAQLYVDPVVGGKYVDNCLYYGQCCGQSAADAYCKVFAGANTKAAHFEVREGDNLPTITLFGQQSCEGKQCHRLRNVLCQ